MGVLQETLPTAALYEHPQQLIGLAVGGIAVATSATRMIEVVHQGEAAIKTRRGQPVERKRVGIRDSLRNGTGLREGFRRLTEEELEVLGRYKNYGPGPHPLVPLYERMVKVNVRDRTDPFEPFEIESDDGQLFVVEGSLTWYVREDGDNPYKARFHVNNEKDNKDKDKDLELKQTTLSICVAGLGRAIGGKGSMELKQVHKEDVTTPTQAECEDGLYHYGAGLRRVSLKPLHRAASEVLKQGLELSRNPGSGLVAADAIAMEADEHGMGQVIQGHFGGDAA